MSSSSNAGSPNNASAKARLTEAEKKQNHILSEKKRRDAIRAGFDRICDIVPNMKGQGRSEAVVLGKTVDYMTDLLAKKQELNQSWLEKGRSQADFDLIYDTALKAARETTEDGGSSKGQVKPGKNGSA